MKKFSLSEAQALLPVVEVLLDRATASSLLAARLEENAALLRVRIFHTGGLAVDIAKAFRDAEERRQQNQNAAGSLAELEQIGVVVKDLATGILAFPSELNGESILLSWQRGESRIGYWHGLHEDFTDRRPFSALLDKDASPKSGQPDSGKRGSGQSH